MKLFVPGRICLFGEHSDWAGGHRRTNAELEKDIPSSQARTKVCMPKYNRIQQILF